MIKRNLPILLAALVLTAISAHAQNIYTWSGATGGSWSTITNWNPNTGYPGTSGGSGNTDVADINNVTATQNVNYDAGASGFLGTLNITQTSAFLNEVTIQKNLTLTNALTLAATSGTAEVLVGPTSAIALSVPSVTVNSGGVLATGFTGSSISISGSLTVNAGGAMSMTNGASLVVNGNLTLTGSINNFGNFPTYNTSATGFIVSGGSNVLNPSNGASISNIALYGATFTTSSVQIGTIFINAFNSGNETLASTYAGSGAQINGLMKFGDETSHSGENLFHLGSNLTVSGALSVGGPSQGSNGTTGGSILFGIDLNSYLLDFTTNGTSTQAFEPVQDSNSKGGATTWNLTDNSVGESGTIKAATFILSAIGAQGGVQGATNVLNRITLQATGTNGTATDLGGNTALGNGPGGTISGSSTFLYSGNAVTARPATLASNRTIGFLNVQNGVLELAGTGAQPSGVISTGSSGGTADSITVNSGGTLMLGPSFTLGTTTAPLTVSGTGVFDLNGNNQTLGAVTLGDSTGGGTIKSSGTGGTATSGTLSASSLTIGGTGISTIAANAVVTGTGSVAITASLGGSSTLVVTGSLSGNATVNANTFLKGTGVVTGTTTVNAGGTLLANTSNFTIGTLNILSSGTFALSISTASGTTSAVTASNLTLNSGAVLTIADTGASTALTPGTVLDFLNYSGTALTSGFNYGGAALTQGESITNLGVNTYTFSYDGTGSQDELTLTVTSVPEPGTWGLILGGLALLGIWQRRTRRAIRA